MLGSGLPDISNLLLAVTVGYLLGATPLADRVSRRSGVNIFEAGTGLAGASNVLHNVGKVPAAVVFLGDMAKGIIAIFVAQFFLGIEGPWLVVPGLAAVIGQWNSIFSRFKGGDGLVVLGGITLAAFPLYGIVGVAVASIVALVAQKMPYSSLVNILVGYMVIIALAMVTFNDDVDTALAMGGLALIVLAHAVLGHARRRRSSDLSDYVSPQEAEAG